MNNYVLIVKKMSEIKKLLLEILGFQNDEELKKFLKEKNDGFEDYLKWKQILSGK